MGARNLPPPDPRSVRVLEAASSEGTDTEGWDLLSWQDTLVDNQPLSHSQAVDARDTFVMSGAASPPNSRRHQDWVRNSIKRRKTTRAQAQSPRPPRPHTQHQMTVTGTIQGARQDIRDMLDNPDRDTFYMLPLIDRDRLLHSITFT